MYTYNKAFSLLVNSSLKSQTILPKGKLICIYTQFSICDPLWEKLHSAQKLKIDLLASKESAKLALSNDAIVALVAASVFAP